MGNNIYNKQVFKNSFMRLINNIKQKLMAFKDMFKDNNDINEKNVVGFSSFAVMSCVLTCSSLFKGGGNASTF